jgi:hypothetical protein
VLGSISIFMWGCARRAMMNRCVHGMAWHWQWLCYLSMRRRSRGTMRTLVLTAVAGTVPPRRRVDLIHADVARGAVVFA